MIIKVIKRALRSLKKTDKRGLSTQLLLRHLLRTIRQRKKTYLLIEESQTTIDLYCQPVLRLIMNCSIKTMMDSKKL